MDAGRNVISTFGVATLSVEEDEKTRSWRGRCKHHSRL